MDDENDDLRPEYDDAFFAQGGVRGKHVVPRSEALCVTRISVDMRQAFPTDDDVENALQLVDRLRSLLVPASTTNPAPRSESESEARRTG